MKTFDLLAHAGRVREILTALARFGFGHLLEQVDLPAGFWSRLVARGGPKRTPWERIRLTAESLGPTFIKAGQILSMRPDLVPQPLVLELRKLQDQVQPFPFAQMLPVLTEELGCHPSEVFEDFPEEPVASGSLAQVYVARLREGGRRVAVKVQRPGIARPMEADLAILLWLAGQLHQRIATLRPYQLPTLVEEVRRGFLQELDFSVEARNQQFFNTQNPAPEQIFAPGVIESHSGPRVLVMDWIDGRRIEAAGLDADLARRLARNGARSLFHQIMIGGFFHADPHGGNVLVTEDGRLCLLDWGLAGHLTRRMRYALADLFIAASSQDAEAMVSIAASLAGPSATPDLRSMEREVTLAQREHFNRAVGHEQLGKFILRLLHIFGRHGIGLTRDYSLMAKAILSIEDTGRALDPDFSLPSIARPILEQLQAERYGAKAIWQRSRSAIQSGLAGLRELPDSFARIARRLESDNLSINMRHRGLEELDDALNSSSNRLTLGIIIAGLIIGSSLIITTKVPPLLLGYPALGIIGYLMSACIGMWVVWDILRHGRHR